jgi:hypothetical protein
MVSARLIRFTVAAVLLLAVCGAASAFAGTLSPTPTSFAYERVRTTRNMTIAAQGYRFGISRTPDQDFVLRVVLNQGTFGTTDPTFTFGSGAGAFNATIRSGGQGATSVEFDVDVTTTIDTTTVGNFVATVRFPVGSDVGTVITVTLDTRDLFGPLDTSGVLTGPIAVVAMAAGMTALADTGTTVDHLGVVPPRTAFVIQNDDTALVAKAPVTLWGQTALVRNETGIADYSPSVDDRITITITGDFTGLSQLALDLDNDGIINTTSGASTIEVFTVASSNTSATLTIAGSRLTGLFSPGVSRTVWWTKVPSAVLTSPRTFGISATISPTSGLASGRNLPSGNSNWWNWQSNGTVLVAPYVTFSPGNESKFRITNASPVDVVVLPVVVLDQGTFTPSAIYTNGFTVPAGGSIHVELSGTPAAGTGAIGPLVTLSSGTQPVRAKATFTVLSATANVAGIVLIASPTGVVTAVPMQQTPLASH